MEIRTCRGPRGPLEPAPTDTEVGLPMQFSKLFSALSGADELQALVDGIVVRCRESVARGCQRPDGGDVCR